LLQKIKTAVAKTVKIMYAWN